MLIDRFLSHAESTEFTDFFSLLCDACAGINAADARGIHRDLTINNANTAPAESKTFYDGHRSLCPPETGGTSEAEGVDKTFDFSPLTSAPSGVDLRFTFPFSPFSFLISPFSFLLSPFNSPHSSLLFFRGMSQRKRSLKRLKSFLNWMPMPWVFREDCTK